MVSYSLFAVDAVLFLSAVALLVTAYVLSQRKPKNFPPGPWGFPILGHLPNLGLEPHKTAAAWIPKYGPIVGVDFASFPCVIISDYKLAREAYSDLAFCGRPKFQVFARRSNGQPEGLTSTSGRAWREQRSFTIRRLRQLGFGTKSMEDVIVQQARELIETLRLEARPTSTHCVFNVGFWNTLWALLAGEPFKQSDPTIRRFTELVVDGFADVNVSTMLANLIPSFANNFPTWLTGDNRLDNIFRDAGELFQPYIDEHRRTRVRGEPRDFIDAYIDEIEAAADDPESSFHDQRGKHGLMATLMDLFVAGIETTGATFSWLCLLLASYPHVQERVVAEIQAVHDNTGRLPLLIDRQSMPYVEAVLHEVMRFRTLIPFGGFHSTTEAIHFHGYDIPKDTMVYINVYEAHNNRKLWGDPENFRPERWLNDRQEFVRREDFMAFSTGRRVCIGEQLARDQLFLFTTCLFHGLRVGLDPNSPPPSLEPRLGGTTLGPKSHQLLFTLRRRRDHRL